MRLDEVAVAPRTQLEERILKLSSCFRRLLIKGRPVRTVATYRYGCESPLGTVNLILHTQMPVRTWRMNLIKDITLTSLEKGIATN